MKRTSIVVLLIISIALNLLCVAHRYRQFISAREVFNSEYSQAMREISFAYEEITKLDTPPSSNDLSETKLSYIRALGQIKESYTSIHLLAVLTGANLRIELYPLVRKLDSIWFSGVQLSSPDIQKAIPAEQLIADFTAMKEDMLMVIKLGKDTVDDQGRVKYRELKNALADF